MSTWMKKQTLIQPHNGTGPWKFLKNELLIHSTNWIDEFSNRYAEGKKQDKKKSTRKKLLYKHAYAFMENYKMQTNLQWQKGGQLTIGVNGG